MQKLLIGFCIIVSLVTMRGSQVLHCRKSNIWLHIRFIKKEGNLDKTHAFPSYALLLLRPLAARIIVSLSLTTCIRLQPQILPVFFSSVKTNATLLNYAPTESNGSMLIGMNRDKHCGACGLCVTIKPFLWHFSMFLPSLCDISERISISVTSSLMRQKPSLKKISFEHVDLSKMFRWRI